MGKNKKRDKKNFQKQKLQKKLGQPKTKHGVVDFLDRQETRKYTEAGHRAKKLIKQYQSDEEESEPPIKQDVQSENSEELGFGHELDQLIYDNEYDFSEGKLNII